MSSNIHLYFPYFVASMTYNVIMKAGAKMDDCFVGKRIAELRIAKGVSARDMSLSIGQSPNYINKIENMKALPSMTAFFYICEYLGTSPQEFFSDYEHVPLQKEKLISDIKKLDDDTLAHLSAIVKKLTE